MEAKEKDIMKKYFRVMIKKIYSSIISLFRSNQKEELKNVIEDLIDENKSSLKKLMTEPKTFLKM